MNVIDIDPRNENHYEKVFLLPAKPLCIGTEASTFLTVHIQGRMSVCCRVMADGMRIPSTSTARNFALSTLDNNLANAERSIASMDTDGIGKGLPRSTLSLLRKVSSLDRSHIDNSESPLSSVRGSFAHDLRTKRTSWRRFDCIVVSFKPSIPRWRDSYSCYLFALGIAVVH